MSKKKTEKSVVEVEVEKSKPTFELPEYFKSTSDWDSHRAALYLTLNTIIKGKVIEFGCGLGSTLPIHKHCKSDSREFQSYETNQEYFFNTLKELDDETTIWLVKDYMKVNINTKEGNVPAIIFVDAAPGELRGPLIEKYANSCQAIIVHDSEESSNYVYKLKDILSKFKHRVDFHIPGMPSTTIVSNINQDIENMKGVRLDNGIFV